jgi:hypothetical protein
MTWALLALTAAVLARDPDPRDPADLVARLGAPRYADRETAAQRLHELGRAAVPALRAAHDARDPEVRSRAAILLDRIEAEALLLPTPIRLEFRDRPLSEAVASIAAQAGVPMVLPPGDGQSERTIALRAAAPVPFWTAFDRLLEAGRLSEQPWTRILPNPPEVFHLLADDDQPPLRTSDHGPFRVAIHELRRRRGYLELQVLVMAEPRLSLGTGDVTLLEAVDDRGQTLLSPDSIGQIQPLDCGPRFWMGAVLPAQIYLKLPRRPGRQIARLRGSIALPVTARKGDPLATVPLTRAAGRSYPNGGATLTITQVETGPDRRVLIALDIQPIGPRDVGLDFQEGQIEVLDTRGQPLPRDDALLSRRRGRGRASLAFAPAGADPQAAPTHLRVFDLIRTTTEIPFTFGDVPIPRP